MNVGVAAVAMSATLPGRTYGLGLIRESLQTDLAIDPTRFSVLNFWAVVLGAAVVLPVGRLIDRVGARVVLAAVAGLLGVSVLLMSRAESEWQLAVTLTLVRGFGQGALSVVAIALVGKWFRRRAGTAMGAFSLLLGVGFVLPLIAVEIAVKAVGWRQAWAGVGFALVFGLVPLGLLLARSSPESSGVPPDDPDPEEGRPTVTVRAALLTPAFWAYTAAAALFNLAFSAVTLDNAALLRERGLAAADANALVLGVLMVSGLAANVGAGLLARRRPLGELLAVGVLALAASLATFPFVGSLAAAVANAVLLGVAGGVVTVVYFAVYGHSYGRTHLGGIQAVVQVVMVFASAAGPVLLSETRDRAGGTAAFFGATAAVAVLLAVAAWAAGGRRA